RFTALIHSVRTTGFGQTFDWSGNQLSKNATWKDYLHGELNVLSRLEILRRHRMLTRPQLKKVQVLLHATQGWIKRPHLNHGDMRLKNVLVDKAGKISAIIDWEHCVSSIAPHWDLSVALHDLSIDAKEEFLAGYGLSSREFRNIAPVIKALNVINYAPYVER